MNKKILISLSVIALAAAVVVGGTVAFFSDTETSTGNTFTAGAIDLKIDNHAWFNGEVVSELTWDLRDIGNELFFNFTDLKPGDWEEDTVSIHVVDNPAWVCVNLTVTKDDDMTCTEPELGDDSLCLPTPGDNNLWDGELGKELQVIFWADDGDNVLETDERPIFDPISLAELLPSGTDNKGGTFIIADSTFNLFGETDATTNNPLPLPGGVTKNIGKAFCFGTLTLNQVQQDAGTTPVNSPAIDPGFSCDGKLVNNASQTDSVMGNLSFFAVQSRNNSEFVCSSWNPNS